MSRKPIIAGNWKMNLLQAQAKEVFEGVKNFVKDYNAPQLPTVVIAPVFTSLAAVEAVKQETLKKMMLFSSNGKGTLNQPSQDELVKAVVQEVLRELGRK